MKEIHRVLFIRTDRIGDTLMNIPAIHLLRQSFPKMWLTFLVDSSVAELYRNHPDIDEVMAIEPQKIKNSLRLKWDLIRKIRKIKYDLAIVSNPSKFFHLLVFLAGIRRRVGYRRKWGFLLNKSKPDEKEKILRHEINWNLGLVGLVTDKPWDGAWPLAAEERVAQRIESLIKRDCEVKKEIIVLHPGTSNIEKRWMPGRFVELCELISADENLQAVLIGGKEEQSLAAEITKKCSRKPVDWTGGLTLSELVALFSNQKVKALVSSDSGPVHIAWMSGTPVVAFYAQNTNGSHPVRWGPRDGKSEVIFKPMVDISSSEVYALLQKVLEKK